MITFIMNSLSVDRVEAWFFLVYIVCSVALIAILADEEYSDTIDDHDNK